MNESELTTKRSDDGRQARSLISFFLLTFTLTWSCFVPAALDSSGLVHLPFDRSILLFFGVFGPTASAFLLVYIKIGIAGIFSLLKSGFDPRLPLGVYTFVVLTPLATALIGYLATGSRERNTDIVSIAITAVIYFFLGGSLGEEFGWRGFALPKLLEQSGPLIASLVVATLWVLWHLPLFWIEGTSQYSTPFWLYTIYIASLALQYTWVYLRTGGSIFACLLLHTFTNLNVVIFPIHLTNGVDDRIFYETALNAGVAIAIIALRPWCFRPPSRNEQWAESSLPR